ncbi:hypothetical protein [Lysobacter gummosus]|uniref:Uncharacterized protein n=1 Tax=Lysobacter gummosus TaxID=262324 RepID=A0ABY3X9F1_9GAMM|nr:hypothetical protein [Lysobacter gummosus]UNP29194.1 hypothetical protein MOV92_22440 [Lysobacter gummosus]
MTSGSAEPYVLPERESGIALIAFANITDGMFGEAGVGTASRPPRHARAIDAALM